MYRHDMLIIGAGLAGLRAAFEGITAGLSTAVITKVHPLRSHSCAAQGGVNAAINPQDNWEDHAYDTVKGADYIGDEDSIDIMCREAPQAVLDIDATRAGTFQVPHQFFVRRRVLIGILFENAQNVLSFGLQS